MPSNSRSGRRFNRRRMSMKGTKTEVTRKRVPRVSTMNKKIKRLESTRELKYLDVAAGPTPFVIPVDGSLTCLNDIPNGTNQSQRVGAEVHNTSIQIRGYIQADGARILPTTVRVVIFWDRQANGELPSPTSTAIDDPGLLFSGAADPDTVDWPFMYETQDRFRVLYDKRIEINPQVEGIVEDGITSSVIPIRKIWKKKIKLSRRTKYDATSGSFESINTNSLWISFFTNAASGAGQPVCNFTSRLYYKDA